MISQPENKPFAPTSDERDQNDHKTLRHAREQSRGFPVGQYLQPPPMLFTRDGHNVFLGDIYRGRAAFLVCSGPSLLSHDLEKLLSRGTLTMAVNNAATVVRPHLWCSVDDPMHFHDAIWKDPAIWKFVPLCHMEKSFATRNERGELERSSEHVGDMPAVFGFRRNEFFQPAQWLYEDTFNWGNHAKRADSLGQKGSRSILYIALRLLFFLGIRRVYLLGCDFKMEMGKQNYAFEQDRSRASVAGNNSSYRILNKRLALLQPYFEQAGFEIINCTPNSGLTVFPYLPFETALREVCERLPRRILTQGMYEQKAVKNKPVPKIPESVVVPPTIQEVRPAGIPKTTIVINLTPADLPKLEQHLLQWWAHSPWLLKCHYLIRASNAGLEQARQSKILRQAPFIQFHRLPASNSLPNLLVDLYTEIKTPWASLLGSTLAATSSEMQRPCEKWFQAGPDGLSRPVLIGQRQEGTAWQKDWSLFEQWAKSSGRMPAEMSVSNNRFTPYPESTAVIAEGCCWLDIEWLRKQRCLKSLDFPEFLSGTSPNLFLSFWALFQRQQILTLAQQQ